MEHGNLTLLQCRLLELLSDLEPRWTLVGGAALVGFYLKHRRTRNLDLFWRGTHRLDSILPQVLSRCISASIEVEKLQSTPMFARLRVRQPEGEVVLMDLVVDPAPSFDPEQEVTIGASRILVASSHDLLVDKLCSLIGRLELRDLIDVEALLGQGLDLRRALADAAQKDTGFSAVTLAWLLESFDPVLLGRTAGIDARTADRLCGFRDQLIAQLLSLTELETHETRKS